MSDFLLFLTIVVAIVITILRYYIYMWVVELEKQGCDCSVMWYRDFLNYGTIILIISSLIYLGIRIGILKEVLDKDFMKTFSPLFTIYSVFALFYLIILFLYTSKLKELECKCSESWVREFGYYYSIIMFIMYGIGIIFAIIGFLSIFMLINNSNLSKNNYFNKVSTNKTKIRSKK